MRRGVAAALAVAAAVTFAPVAQADDVQNFIDRLHSRGIYAGQGDGSLVQAGQEVCGYLDQGYTPMQVAEEVYRRTDNSIDGYDAGFIVGAAIANLCPENNVSIS